MAADEGDVARQSRLQFEAEVAFELSAAQASLDLVLYAQEAA
jgi:hypothetical protein